MITTDPLTWSPALKAACDAFNQACEEWTRSERNAQDLAKYRLAREAFRKALEADRSWREE